MAGVVYERWSDREWLPGQSAQRAWNVDRVDSESEAIALLADEVDENATFPQDSRLYAGVPRVTMEGPRAYKVVCPYSATQQSGGPNTDPIDRNPRFRWSRGETVDPSDVDAYDNPIFNAAGDPVTPSPGLPGYYRILTVTRYESTYDLALAEAYEGTWNTDSVYIPKTPGPVAPGRILCVSYEPTTDYDLKASYVQVQYVFWLRRGVRQDNFTATDKVWDAWKFRLLNAGLNGWYQFSAGPPAVYKKTRLTRANSDGRYEPVTDPVPLDASGKPVPSDVKVGNAGSAPVANPTLLDSKLIETGSLSTTFLKYYKYKGAAFRGLNLFLAGATT